MTFRGSLCIAIAAAAIVGSATHAGAQSPRLNERGPADAPVTVVEYCSYGRIPCARLDALMFGTLNEYAASVRVVFRDVPADESEAATARFRAALAAGMQERFWDMHAMLMANPEHAAAADLRRMAQQLGLDVSRFEQDMAGDTVAAAVQDARDAAIADGVSQVPRVLVNGVDVTSMNARDLRAALTAAGAR